MGNATDSCSSAATTAVKSTTYGYADIYHLDRVTDEYRYAGDSATAAASEQTHYTYDDATGLGTEQLAQGRVVQVDDFTLSGGVTTLVHSTHTVFDPITGQPSSVASDEGMVNHVYDAATGRLIETWTGTSHAAAITDTLYGYDLQGRLASVSIAKQNGQTPSLTWSGNRFDAVGNAVAFQRGRESLN